MAGWLLFAVLAGFVVEYGLMYLRPRYYARLAFLPFVRREEVLPTRAVPVGYRDVQRGALNLSELGLDGLRYEDEETLGAFEHGRGWLRMRYKLFGWNRAMGIVAIVPRIVGDTLRLETRVFPSFTVSMFPIVFVAPNPGVMAVMATVLTVTFGLTLLMLRSRARASLSLFLDAIESRARETQLRKLD